MSVMVVMLFVVIVMRTANTSLFLSTTLLQVISPFKKNPLVKAKKQHKPSDVLECEICCAACKHQMMTGIVVNIPGNTR